MPNSNLQRALDAYNSSNRANYPLNGSFVTNLEAVEYYLAEASSQLPQHCGVPITIANMQTFRGEIAQALNGYCQCLSAADSTAEAVLALSYLTAWHHYAGDSLAASRYLEQLQQIDAELARDITLLLALVSQTLSQPISYIKPASLVLSGTDKPVKHAIVTLGHVLNDDGSMAPALIQRLEQTLQLAQQLPESLLLVTGGQARQGKTESQQMKHWLIGRGIKPCRIIEEDLATNTIDNARLSIELLVKHQITNATLVSSSVHVHRSQLLFEILAITMNISTICFNHYAADDGLSATPTPTGQVRRNCYIDALRAYGLPAFNCAPFVQV